MAGALTADMNLPLISKDTIKEALMSVLPVPDVAASKDLGRAAIAIMYALAAEAGGGAVLENCFHRTASVDEIARLPGSVAEVFCRCSREVALERYRARAHSRHPGHFDHARRDDQLWNSQVTGPIAGGWPVLEVDTVTPVDIAAVVGWLRAQSEVTGR
jgi:hypothetical protein